MEEDGPRLAKMRQAYKRAIQEILKEQEKIKEILTDPSAQSEDSFFMDSSKARETHRGDPEAISNTIEGIFQSLRSRLSDVFRKKLEANDIPNKLNQLDRDVLEGRTSLRDVTSKEYIREIFESHLVGAKVDYIDYVEETKREALERIRVLKNELERATEEMGLLRKENSLCNNAYNSLINSFSEAVKNKNNQ
ncbi:hypothetical protein EHEL_020140 [Encephalitozoon hellem ATCC 50504]|uniref:Uncharacterized protein n=1 Tax=Encephalitozoon hellem TaxID=27973 RepID=A0A9Q9C1T2_ENCHE|nr:uncharacterized protein EHEL_020140 [Encephalitozoon hellem ATCC 50504]AFM97771.1 hypothetical protein EHEL_020140 [Encephalitozoon hellem ATCC 50504]UTX42539.1 hypothetical protein GPU96_02g02490 [Encephalitozoon hellem]WEL37994.1 hypothetical protein PFJ87_02g00300 [Encephalitozoon hellem]|eukprot:XP_003886752.1 hypothetical protein EHEL_020140 [Encephalitozoon hellem ATCC 50504]